jgi:hypothetical protein
MVFLSKGRPPVSLAAFCALFATIGSGCVPPGSDQFTKPVASSAAASDPVVLNGAGGKISHSAAKTEAKVEPAPSAAATADAAANGAAPADAGPSPAPPLSASKPLAPLPETPAVAAAPPDPAAADQANGKNANGFPNINTPAKEPASKLLPDDERARVISELEALRKKGGATAKDAGGVEVAKKSGGKTKAVGKCPDGATAATDPACKANQ